MRRRCRWLGVGLACAACAGPAPAPAPTPVAATTATTASATEPADDAAVPSDAERLARARWFPFELTAVHAVHGGDWDAFVAAKEAREAELDAAWEQEAARYDEHLHLRSAEDVRAVRALFEEFEQVAAADRDAVIAEARRVLRALQAGAFDEVARDCVFYGGEAAERARRCEAMLDERRDEIGAAVRDLDPASLDPQRLTFSSPEPEAGMTGQVVIPFGPPAPEPRDPMLYPPTWQIELWWSGQVMPEANGPRHARPLAPDQPPGRWRFYDVIPPYSRRPVMRI